MSADVDPLLELLLPHIPASSVPPPSLSTPYLSRLTSLPLAAVKTTEPSTLASAAHSTNLALQSLAARSHRSIISSDTHVSTLPASLAALNESLTSLTASLPPLDSTLTAFTTTYTRDSAPLLRRSEARTLHSNLERVLDILHLPSLLHSLIASANYAAALDTLSHSRRLRSLYPSSPVITSIATECESLQQTLISTLLVTLRGPLKLPVAMKTVGFLRRAAVDDVAALFLVCRMSYIHTLLSALSPLRELADTDKLGVNTERYLKRWLEVIREQSFGVLSMYRSIFPAAVASSGSSGTSGHVRRSSSMSFVAEDAEEGDRPDAVAGFVAALVDLVELTLATYLPNVKEKGVRESLLTQVLYASGSLGRLGGEFAGVLDFFNGDEEFVAVVGRQKVLAARLEALAGGRGGL